MEVCAPDCLLLDTVHLVTVLKWVTYLNTTAILVSDTSIAVALVICLRRADRIGHAR